MYNEEQIINGVLCSRSIPNGEWIPYTLEQLSERVERINSYLDGMQSQRQQLIELVIELNGVLNIN